MLHIHTLSHLHSSKITPNLWFLPSYPVKIPQNRTRSTTFFYIRLMLKHHPSTGVWGSHLVEGKVKEWRSGERSTLSLGENFSCLLPDRTTKWESWKKEEGPQNSSNPNPSFHKWGNCKNSLESERLHVIIAVIIFIIFITTIIEKPGFHCPLMSHFVQDLF